VLYSNAWPRVRTHPSPNLPFGPSAASNNRLKVLAGISRGVVDEA
jgi:hypothetical protein